MRWTERISPVVRFYDGDVGVVAEGQDAFACVRGADAEVVHLCGAAEAHLAFGVEAVVAQPVVLLGARRRAQPWGWPGRPHRESCGPERGENGVRCSARGTRRVGVAGARCW